MKLHACTLNAVMHAYMQLMYVDGGFFIPTEIKQDDNYACTQFYQSNIYVISFQSVLKSNHNAIVNLCINFTPILISIADIIQILYILYTKTSPP